MSPALDLAWSAIRPHRPLLATALMSRAVFRLLPVQAPLITGAFIDALHSGTVTALSRLGLAMTALALATGLFAYVSERSSARLGRVASATLRSRMMEAWEHAPSGFHDRYGASSLLDRTLNETRAVGRLARKTLVEGTASGLRLLYPAVMLLWLEPKLAWLPLAAIPLQALLTRWMQRSERNSGPSVRTHKAALLQAVKENLEAIETVQALCAERSSLGRLEEASRRLEQRQELSGRRSSRITAAVWAVSALAVAGTWWLGATRVAAGYMSSGELVAFTGFVAFLTVPLRRLTAAAKSTRGALQSMQRLHRMLQEAGSSRDATGSEKDCSGTGDLELRDVTCAVGGQPVLRRASLIIRSGELLGIRGRGGCGKSTLLRLLACFLAPDAGQVRWGNHDLSLCAPSFVRRHIALVAQRPAIFSGTVIENLTLGQPGYSLYEIAEALHHTGLAARVAAWHDGLDSRLGEGGRKLSGGEAYRLSIARALLRKPRVLLLDEPASALDAQAEGELFERLQALTPALTVVVVASELRAMEYINRCVELRDGCFRDVSHSASDPYGEDAVVATNGSY